MMLLTEIHVCLFGVIFFFHPVQMISESRRKNYIIEKLIPICCGFFVSMEMEREREKYYFNLLATHIFDETRFCRLMSIYIIVQCKPNKYLNSSSTSSFFIMEKNATVNT